MTLTTLREVPLLSPMSEGDLAALRGQSDWAWYQPGEVVVRQGQAVADFFLVVAGQVELVLEGEVQTRLGLLSPGDFFGELSALTGDPAPATAIAREVTSLLRLSHEGLMQLLERNSELNRSIIATLAARVKEAGARLHRTRLRERSLADHITRQAALTHQEWVGAGAWSQRIRAAIVRGGRSLEPVLFVGEPGTGKELAAARLHYNSQRKEGPFIVLEMTSWTEQRWEEATRLAAHGSLLLKQIDRAPAHAVERVCAVLPRAVSGSWGQLPGRIPRVLATAGPTEEREPGALEEALLREGFAVAIPPLRERREDIPPLIRHFVRKHGYRPGGEAAIRPVTSEALRKLETYPYLKANVRELERVLHQAMLLAAGSPIGVEHLRLSYRPERSGRPRVGLALGGGVVRGCAHIGMVRALQEAGIPIDFIAGTSSGSLIGGLIAGGMSWEALQALVAGTGWADFAEPCWPRGGFLTNSRMRAFLDRQIGPVSFADLRIPFAAVAGDVGSGREVILREGRVADAIRASTAIPGIFRPVEVEGRWLMDGVVVNNVPASVVRAMGADLVIASDVTNYANTPGPPRSAGEAVMRAFDIAARQSVSASLEWADIVIRPEVGGVNGFSFKSAPELIRRGYVAAQAQIPGILARLEELRREGA